MNTNTQPPTSPWWATPGRPWNPVITIIEGTAGAHPPAPFTIEVALWLPTGGSTAALFARKVHPDALGDLFIQLHLDPIAVLTDEAAPWTSVAPGSHQVWTPSLAQSVPTKSTLSISLEDLDL